MTEFLSQYGILMFALAGGLVSFLYAYFKYMAAEGKMPVLLVLSMLAFAVFSGQQIVKFINDQNAAEARANRERIEKAEEKLRKQTLAVQTQIIGKIEKDVVRLRFTAEGIADRLEDVSLDTLGTPLVQPDWSQLAPQIDEKNIFAKGNPAIWRSYAQWLEGQGERASLSLTLGARKNYNPGLLLAFLMTTRESRDEVQTVVAGTPTDWMRFPDAGFVERHAQNLTGVHWVVFLEQGGTDLLAYADAREFTRELIIYLHTGGGAAVRKILNEPSADPIARLSDMFGSVKKEIVREANVREAVARMLDRQLPLVAVVSGERQFIVRLEQVVRLAADKTG